MGAGKSSEFSGQRNAIGVGGILLTQNRQETDMDARCKTKIYRTKCVCQMDEDANFYFYRSGDLTMYNGWDGVGVGHLLFGKKTMGIIMERLK